MRHQTASSVMRLALGEITNNQFRKPLKRNRISNIELGKRIRFLYNHIFHLQFSLRHTKRQ